MVVPLLLLLARRNRRQWHEALIQFVRFLLSEEGFWGHGVFP